MALKFKEENQLFWTLFWTKMGVEFGNDLIKRTQVSLDAWLFIIAKLDQENIIHIIKKSK